MLVYKFICRYCILYYNLCVTVTTIIIIFNHTNTMETSRFPHVNSKNPLSSIGIKLPDVRHEFKIMISSSWNEEGYDHTGLKIISEC